MEKKIFMPFVLFLGIAFIIFIDITVYKAETIIKTLENFRGWIFIIGNIILVHNSIWTAIRIKDISIDDSFLYISNLLGKEIKVPLSNIVRAEQTCLMRVFNEFVLITLDVESEFGKKIFFIPDGRKHIFLEPHPVVDELNRLVSSHKQKKRNEETGG